MDDSLPTDVAQLQTLLLQSREELLQRDRQLQLAKQQTIELNATVAEQRGKLEAAEQRISELIRALRGKQRERLDPDQLLLFDIGELETLLDEQADVETETKPRRRKKKRGQRLIPENAPREERVYELPESERLCPHW